MPRSEQIDPLQPPPRTTGSGTAVPAPDPMATLASRLASLLPEPPARVVAVGWEGALGDRLARLRENLERRRELAAEPPAAALVWNAAAAIPWTEVLEPAVRLLEPRGTLVAVIPAVAPPATRRRHRGGLPEAEERGARRLVRSLTAAGFAIRREIRTVVGNHAGGLRIFVTRPDRFRIRSYREGDEAAILRLFPKCFHAPRSLEEWRWKYVKNPWGDRLISLAFSPDGELAAHYSGYPVPFWRGDPRHGRDLLGLQMGDTMTHPAFRNAGRGSGGLLARTVRHFFALHRDGSMAFFFGFNTGPIQKFCDWFIGGSRIEPVSFWTRPLEAREALPWQGDGGYRIERATSAGADWDSLFRRAAPHYRFLVRRDAAYVDWRHLRCPQEVVVLAVRRRRRLVGWGAFRRRGERLVWGDALFHPRHAAAAEILLHAAAERPELAGAARLDAWFSERPAWWLERLTRLGLARAPEPDGLGLIALADGEPEAIETLRNELYYTMADGDLF